MMTQQEDVVKPWFAQELAEHFRTVAKPPIYVPGQRSFATASKCYYGKRELGPRIRRRVGHVPSYR